MHSMDQNCRGKAEECLRGSEIADFQSLNLVDFYLLFFIKCQVSAHFTKRNINGLEGK